MKARISGNNIWFRLKQPEVKKFSEVKEIKEVTAFGTSTTDKLIFIHLANTLLWAMATFWLPLLVILEVWRHVKAGFTYSPGYWSMVFPLGMYTVATLHLSSVLQLPLLNSISQVFVFIALTVWLLTYAGMLKSLFINKQDEKTGVQ